MIGRTGGARPNRWCTAEPLVHDELDGPHPESACRILIAKARLS